MKQLSQLEMARKSEVTRGTHYALISDVKRYALHDGPGVRTSIFFKGCPLHCLWCDNPETQEMHEELNYYVDECNFCGRCVEACPYGAISVRKNGQIHIERELCRTDCYPNPPCVEACYMSALQVVGKKVTLTSLMQIIEKDAEIYHRSGGGVTVTGGEPGLQSRFVTKLLKKCHEYGINTAIETCGYTEWECLAEISEYVNFIFYDIKLYDSELHKAFTGKGNDLILQNSKLLSRKTARAGTKMIIRTPIVPGFTDSLTNLKAIANFVTSELAIKNVELLPYHRLGKGKYKPLGRQYKLPEVRSPTAVKITHLRGIFERKGLKVECY